MTERARRGGLRAPAEFVEPDQCDLGCPVPLQKYFGSRLHPNQFIIAPSRPTEGRFAIVTNAGRDAVDAGSTADERC